MGPDAQGMALASKSSFRPDFSSTFPRASIGKTLPLHKFIDKSVYKSPAVKAKYDSHRNIQTSREKVLVSAALILGLPSSDYYLKTPSTCL